MHTTSLGGRRKSETLPPIEYFRNNFLPGLWTEAYL